MNFEPTHPASASEGAGCMPEESHDELRSLVGRFLVDFVLVDSSVASLFSAAFGVRVNCVEILYAVIPLQARVECLSSLSAHSATTLSPEARSAIKDILGPVKELQSLRNLLAHNMLLDTDLIIRGSEEASPKSPPGKLFVWRTKRDGDYEIRPITTDEIRVALDKCVQVAGQLTKLCVALRMRHGLRP
jgi:hypothetical protein